MYRHNLMIPIRKDVLISIFNPAEFYPPTLNAVEYLAGKYDSVVLVTHSIEGDNQWKFPENVEVIFAGQWPVNLGKSGPWKNANRFIRYALTFRKIFRRNQYNLVLLYEPYAVLAYKLATLFYGRRTPMLWYHNHDILEPLSQGKFSIGRFAIKAEQAIFPILSIFSLPSNERKEFFPMHKLKGKYFFIPNYPSKKFYNKFYKQKTLSHVLRIIFQGRIAEGHGLEDIIALLSEPIEGKKLSLHLKGMVENEYKEKLLALAMDHNVTDKLFFHGLTSYKEVPSLASTCHIGVAIHTKTDIMNKTLGTSSNKIYEYAALGLPVLLYDNAHFREHLEKYPWAIFTDCSKNSLQLCLGGIVSRYQELSKSAYRDFSEGLNFEEQVSSVTNYIAERNAIPV